MIQQTTGLHIWRCGTCHTILAKINLAPGSIVEVKCKCNAFNVLHCEESVLTRSPYGYLSEQLGVLTSV